MLCFTIATHLVCPKSEAKAPAIVCYTVDAAGRPAGLRCGGGANGAEVEVLVDHAAGSLAYRLNGGPCLEALPLTGEDRALEGPRAFPEGAALRPYVSCYYPGESISFVGCHVCSWGAGS